MEIAFGHTYTQDRQTDRKTQAHVRKRTQTQTERQTDKQTDRHAHRIQPHTHTRARMGTHPDIPKLTHIQGKHTRARTHAYKQKSRFAATSNNLSVCLSVCLSLSSPLPTFCVVNKHTHKNTKKDANDSYSYDKCTAIKKMMLVLL